MKYSVAIRTLGKAGEKYQALLDSLKKQSIQPADIFVYIAEGYPIPQETIHTEQYIYVPKGMIAQRALDFKEIKTEYILFLDDDVYLPPNGVETLYAELRANQGDIIAPDVFSNSERPFFNELQMTISGRMRSRNVDGQWGYKVIRTGGYSYNKHPSGHVYESQTNAGPCFFCKKKTMLETSLKDELWLDNMPYAMGDDEAMFYKMYLMGFKVLTIYNSGILHLDAGSTLNSYDRQKTTVYCDFRFKTIFWHRFIFKPEKLWILKIWDKICITYALGFGLSVSLVKGQMGILKKKCEGIHDGIKFINGNEYKKLPLIKNTRI